MKTKILGRVKGLDGKNFCVGATVNSVDDLPIANSVAVGTHYYVGTEAPRQVYFSDGVQWTNQGYMYSIGNENVGNMYKEQINFDINNVETNESSDIIVYADNKVKFPDMISGCVGFRGNNSMMAYTSGLKLMGELVEDDGSKVRIFFSDSAGSLGDANNVSELILYVATGSFILEMINDIFPDVVISPEEVPARLIMIILNRRSSSQPMSYIDISGIYCDAE